MKNINWVSLVIVGMLVILSQPCFAADSESGTLEIIDKVYEIAPDSSYLQVGDYGISKIINVWQETTAGDKQLIPLSRIQAGSIVKVTITQEGSNELWVAEEMYLLSDAENEKSTNKANSGAIYFDDGQWKN